MRLTLLALIPLVALALTACPKEDDTGNETDDTSDTSDSDDSTDPDAMPCEAAFGEGHVPERIDAYTWDGRTVYLANFGCCDQYEELYDATTCELLCAPSGGITGEGDGRCPDFYDEATRESTVWPK